VTCATAEDEIREDTWLKLLSCSSAYIENLTPNSRTFKNFQEAWKPRLELQTTTLHFTATFPTKSNIVYAQKADRTDLF